VNSYDGVLFIGFGGPEKSEDTMPFLELVTRGRGIPRERLVDVAHHYEKIGGASPINEITRRQAAALERQLRTQGSKLNVYMGQRNWHPFLEDTLQKMTSDGVKYAIGFPAAAHRCEASWERYLAAVEEARQNVGASAPVVDYIDPWFDHPLFIEAICERIRELSPSPPSPSPSLRERVAKPGEGESWYFTAHSIPVPMANESRYVQELERTAALVAERLGRKEWKLAYSSRSGRPQDPWLEPDVSDAILEEARRGTKEILFIPIGFIADHVEVLYDLDIEAQETARKAGVRLRRSKTVGDHPLFVQMMADLIEKRCFAQRRLIERRLA
jgi:ferrochelatase